MKALPLTALIPFALLVACGRTEPPPASSDSTTAPPAATAPAPPDAATAPATPPNTATNQAAAQVTLAGPPAKTTGKKAAKQVGGNLQLVTGTAGVLITGQITGLAPNTTHGFHVHETGDCSAPDFKSAGGHFNPDNAMHGDPASTMHHLGDIPNIKSDAKGVATVNATITGATLNDGGPHDLVGKALIVHAKKDDYKTQPSGDSGDRIACGVIERLP